MAKANLADVAAKIHYRMVMNDNNGYSQHPVRWGGDYGASETLHINGRAYTYDTGSYDCSSSVITAWRLAIQGTPYEGSLDGATYTGDMREVFVGSGLFDAVMRPAVRGDVYLAEGKHTAMCQDGGNDGVMGYDCLSEFNRNENHGATWGYVGDQDGYEAVAREFYEDGWNVILAYNHKADYEIEEKKVAKQNPGNAKNDAGLKYHVHVQELGDLAVVHDGQLAGTTGSSKRMEALMFDAIPSGWELYARAHIANVGWVDFGKVEIGEVIGSKGKSNAIEALIIGVSKKPTGDNRKLYFQVHQQNVGTKRPTPEGFCSGSDGLGLRLEAVSIWIA